VGGRDDLERRWFAAASGQAVGGEEHLVGTADVDQVDLVEQQQCHSHHVGSVLRARRRRKRRTPSTVVSASSTRRARRAGHAADVEVR
jgi:hypothetical protein